MKKYFEANSSDHYCIFFNSIEGIRSLIGHFKLKEDYRIFCSKESVKLLKRADEPNTSFIFDHLEKYNFFTSNFFTGLDINIDYEVDIIILTDCDYREHTMLDPFTDILQIIGRFRKRGGVNSKVLPYRKVIHINNVKHFTNPITEEVALLKVNQSKAVFDQIETLKQSAIDEAYSKLFAQALQTVNPYAKLLNKKGVYSHFLFDNYLDNERVKNYYRSPYMLKSAYNQTGYYNEFQLKDTYDPGKYYKFAKTSVRYSSAIIRAVANELLELQNYIGLDVYYNYRQELEELYPFITKAFDKVGYELMSKVSFKRREIERELIKLEIEEKKDKLPLIRIIYKHLLSGGQC